jgi:hypothetical protein
LEFIFPDAILDEISDPMDVDKPDSKKLYDSKKFTLCSERQKRRKTKPMRELDPEEVCYASKMSLKSSGNIDASKVFEHVCLTKTEDAPLVRKLCANSDTIVVGNTPDTELALLVSAKLTMDQYNLLCDSATQIGFNLKWHVF